MGVGCCVGARNVGNPPNLFCTNLQGSKIIKFKTNQHSFELIDVLQELPLQSLSLDLQDNQIIITGGTFQDQVPKARQSWRQPVNYVYIFHQIDLTITQKQSMLEPRVGHSLALLNDKVYAIGGSLDGITSNCRCERYCLKFDNWEYILPLNTERMYASACTIQDSIFICGGRVCEDKISQTIEIFNLQKEIWTQIDVEMPIALWKHGCITVSQQGDKQILIFGGCTDQDNNQITYTFDYNKQKFQQLQSMPNSCNYVGATAQYWQKYYAFDISSGSTIWMYHKGKWRSFRARND